MVCSTDIFEETRWDIFRGMQFGKIKRINIWVELFLQRECYASFYICNGNNKLEITLDCLICGLFIVFFYCFTDLTKKKTKDISVVRFAKIAVNAIISKLLSLTTETAEGVLSMIMLSLMSTIIAAAFLAANELGYSTGRMYFLLLNGRLSKNTVVFKIGLT